MLVTSLFVVLKSWTKKNKQLKKGRVHEAHSLREQPLGVGKVVVRVTQLQCKTSGPFVTMVREQRGQHHT